MVDSTVPSSTATASAAPAGPPELPAPPATTPDTPDTTSVLYRAALGEVHPDYYLALFDRMDAAERWRPHWNWWASLCTLNWLVFRQLWHAALYYAGCVVAGFLLIFGIGRLVFQFSPSTELVLAGAFAVALFAVPGMLGTTLLHADCRKRMTLALRASNTDEEARLTLVGQASTRRRMGVLVALNAVGATLVALAVSQWLEFLGSAGSQAQPAAIKPIAVAATPASAAPAPLPAAAPPAASSSTVAAASPAASVAPPASAASALTTTTELPRAAATPTAAASTPVAPVAALAVPATPPRPSAGTAGRSAQGPVDWEALKIAPPRPDVAPTVVIEPKKLSIDSPWTGANRTPANTGHPNVPTKSEKLATGEKHVLINVGLFAVEVNARNALAKLDAQGLPATLEPLHTAKGPRYRVRVGPYANRRDAEVAATNIRTLGLEAVVVESSRPPAP